MLAAASLPARAGTSKTPASLSSPWPTARCATVEEGWILPASHPAGYDQRFDVNGDQGRVELVGHESGVTVMDGDRLAWPDTQLWPAVHGEIEGALRRETWHFVDVLRGAAKPLVTGADGLAALRIALAVEESQRTGNAVQL